MMQTTRDEQSLPRESALIFADVIGSSTYVRAMAAIVSRLISQRGRNAKIINLTRRNYSELLEKKGV